MSPEADRLKQRMLRLAAQLSVGWDTEPDPSPTYVAYGQAFTEAARRIREEIEAGDE